MALFSDISDDIIQKKQTGLFSVVTTNGKHHLKVFFSEGEIYYLLYGDLKDAECLAACKKLEFADCFFASGVKVNAQSKCTLPTTKIIDELRKCFAKGTSGRSNFSGIQEKLKVALVRQVGPIGEIVFPSVLEQWQASSPPTRQQVLELVDLIEKRIEDEKCRTDFVNEANRIIS